MDSPQYIQNGRGIQPQEAWLCCQVSDKSVIWYSVTLLELEMVAVLALTIELWPQPQAIR